MIIDIIKGFLQDLKTYLKKWLLVGRKELDLETVIIRSEKNEG